MKTFLVALQMAYAVCFLCICGKAETQIVIGFEVLSDSTITVRLHNAGTPESHEQLILVIDDTVLTCKFKDYGMVSLHALLTDAGHISGNTSYSFYFGNEKLKTESASQKLYIPKVCGITEEPDTEEPLHVEEWMLKPDKWISSGLR